MRFPDLTDRRYEILRTLAHLEADVEGSVLGRDLSAALRISRQALAQQLPLLERAGYLEYRRQPRQQGTLRLTAKARAALGQGVYPVLGEIAAGEPTLADGSVQGYAERLADLLPLRDGDFLLRVRGESMTGVGIYPGDYVAVRPGTDILEGEIAVVLIPGEDGATLKRWYLDGNRVLLVSENPAFAPMSFARSEVRLQGVMVGHVGGGRPRRSRQSVWLEL
ncbi:repressor LexA [Deinobacterium chartae]|uniref:Repressor LexA n=1 Tax=Deinobacterium chartae TaxID=521158 RepID=A0A841HZ62_9DEIO|nr:transcriptional repressor LexA [Deinobacterium chartae]MBB6098213.1 repressor LexA [Deinobacterium chartae]